MYGEDIEAMRNFQTPSMLLEVKGDHLEVVHIGWIGRLIRWLGLGYKNTTLDKVTQYLADNITDWSISKNGYRPIKRLLKRIRKANRINPQRFPEHVAKIEECFAHITPTPITRNIHDMTDAELLENMENLTIREYNEIPYSRVWKLFIAPSPMPQRLIDLIAPEPGADDPIVHEINRQVFGAQHSPIMGRSENSEALALSISKDMEEAFEEDDSLHNENHSPHKESDSLHKQEEMQGSFSDPLASSVTSSEPPQSHKDDHESLWSL